MTDARSDRSILILTGTLSVLAVAAGLWLIYLVFSRIPTERTIGIAQLIYYIHLPSALTGYLAFAIVAVCSAGYLWLKDDRLDAISVSAAELGVIFASAVLVQGPLWARLSWESWWVWDARTTSTLLLWLVYVSYFVVRFSTENPERGKRFAGVLGVIGVVDLPIIHMSVQWFHTQRLDPVALGPESPATDPEVFQTVVVGTLAFTLAFFALLLHRYRLERLRRQVDAIQVRAVA